MTIPSLNALSNVSPLGGVRSGEMGVRSAAPAGTPDFASVLADLTNRTASDVKAGEETAIKGIQGQAPVQDVVQAVMKAQTSLQTALAIRDKVVSAYQDLTRMPI